jgi:hypothetical protein
MDDKSKNFFVLAEGENREPWQIALDGLLDLGIEPGDVINQDEITRLLPMIPIDSLGTPDEYKAYTLARFPQIEALVEGFENETGLTMITNYRGGYLVLPRDDVADVVFGVMSRKISKALAWAAGKLARASSEEVSQPEMKRRTDAENYIREFRTFFRRNRPQRFEAEEEAD